MCGWFTSEWLTIIIQIRSYVNSTYTNRTLHQFQFLTSTCSHIALTSIHPKVVKAKIWIEKNTIGGHRMSLICLSRRPDCTSLPSTLCTWVGITREWWSRSGTRWTLTSNWVSQYRIRMSLWMSWHTYHAYTSRLKRWAFVHIFLFLFSI
jgi:hypothetical protein